jgi:hypothetical protein
MGFARRLVATTDRVFTFATAEGRIADLLRMRVAPVLLPAILTLHPAREFLFRTVSQLVVSYRGKTLSVGSAGHVHGGDRLPWVPGDDDNFVPLAAMTWQVHVYGTPTPELSSWCAEHQVPLQVFGWSAAHGAAGLAKDALYLLRPDTYVALADAGGSAGQLDQYFAEHGIKI